MAENEPSWLDYFAGGVPTGEYLRMTLDDLREVCASQEHESSPVNRVLQLCFIGLLCYFEAFCKDHFASLINIEPGLVRNLRDSGQNVSIDAAHVVLYGDKVSHRIGFVLAEKYDFGSGSRINSLFSALLKVTPFTKDDAKKYSALLRDRNLLVHHGGTFTLSYLEQTARRTANLTEYAFFNSRTLKSQEVLDAIAFIEGVARKMLRATHDALAGYFVTQGSQYSTERQTAMDAILWWDKDRA